jgi:DNA polymerase III delta prime subunit
MQLRATLRLTQSLNRRLDTHRHHPAGTKRQHGGHEGDDANVQKKICCDANAGTTIATQLSLITPPRTIITTHHDRIGTRSTCTNAIKSKNSQHTPYDLFTDNGRPVLRETNELFCVPWCHKRIQQVLASDSECKRLLLHGPPGSSKTFTLQTILNILGFDPDETLDAVSENQNEEKIYNFIEKWLKSSGLGSSDMLKGLPIPCLTIDNVIGSFVRVDDGGRDTLMVIKMLIKVLKGEAYETGPGMRPPTPLTTHRPLVIIADSCTSPEMKELSTLMTDSVRFYPYSAKRLCEIGRKLMPSPEMLSETQLKKYADMAAGDLRKFKNFLSINDCSSYDPSSRDIFNTAKRLLANSSDISRDHREDLEKRVAGQVPLFSEMVFENYAKGHRPSQRTKEAEVLALEAMADQADALGDMDIVCNHWAMGNAPGEEVPMLILLPPSLQCCYI